MVSGRGRCVCVCVGGGGADLHGFVIRISSLRHSEETCH